MKGIDKRTHKDGTVSYRARVRIKGHPVLIQSFDSKTLAIKWKRDTESAIERGTFTYEKPVDEVVSEYGYLIVDECHHLPPIIITLFIKNFYPCQFRPYISKVAL